MSNFNQFFKSTGAKMMVNKFFFRVDMYNPNYKITKLDWYIEDEPDESLAYYIENGLTATFKVIIDYHINNSPEVLTTSFEVPREIDSMFIIEGAIRQATNTLGIDYDCRIHSADDNIRFDFDRTYFISRETLEIRKVDASFKLPNDVFRVKLKDIDNLTGAEKELLKLSERQAKKFQVKLNLDYYPEYISSKLIEDCIEFGDDKLKDLIVDKTIETVSKGFMNFLFRPYKGSANYYDKYKTIVNSFTKNNRLPDPVNVITNLCRKYWKESKGDNIETDKGINAINVEAQDIKITIPTTVAYNKTMADLIDVTDTPINNSSGRINSLTISSHIDDSGRVLFDVFDKNFKKITIDYLDYLNSKVVASESVDYENKGLIPDKDGKVRIKYRMREMKADVSEIDLIDLHPDYRLSRVVRRIPFVNFTDSVRINMGSSMLKQAIPLVNAERSLVDTGNNEELSSYALNENFKYDSGKVKSITEDEIEVEVVDGKKKKTVKYLRKTASKGHNDVNIFFEPKVKIGQKLKRGDVVTGPTEIGSDTVKSGINALVLFHAMFGHEYEDAVVVSESFAKKMCHYSIIDITRKVYYNEAIKWIPSIGTKVKSKDSVLTLNRANALDETNKRLQEQLGGLFDAGNESLDISDRLITEVKVPVPNNIDDAIVSDVSISEMKKPEIRKSVKVPDYTYARTSRKYISAYEAAKDRKIIYDKYPEYVAANTFKEEVKMDPKEYQVVFLVRIRLIKRTELMLGSKLTNRYGGKGVVSKILPDNRMPIMVDEKGKRNVVEVVMNPYSTINRKIPSVIMENSMGLIAHKLHDLVEEYKTTKEGRKKIKPLLQKYYPGRFDDMTEEEIIKKHNNERLEEVYYFNVGSFTTKYTPAMIEEWMKELGVKSQSKILMLQEDLVDLKELKENLSEEEYNKAVKKITGKFVEVDKPLMCGYITIIELFKIPYYDQKVTTSLFNANGGDINPYKDDPIMGHGKYRTEGQSIGEMELAAYLSRGARKFIDYSRKDTTEQDSLEFMNNLLGLGIVIKNDSGYNIGASSLRDSLNDMKVKFRVKKSIIKLPKK